MRLVLAGQPRFIKPPVLASIPETAAALFSAIMGMQYEGIDLDRSLEYARRMTELDLDEVQAEAMNLAPLDRAVIIIAGDPDQILPQLAAMGITDVETITLPTMPAGMPVSMPAS